MRPRPFSTVVLTASSLAGAKVVRDIGFKRRLIALQRQQIVGAMGEDLVGNLDLTPHGIDGHQRTFELLCLGELVKKIGDSGDFVALLRNAYLRQDQPGRSGISTERVQSLEPAA